LSKQDTGDPREDSGDPREDTGNSNESLQNKPTYPVYVAIDNFSATDCNELSFKKGRLLYIIKSKELDENRWFARAKDSGRVGYVPRNYLRKHIPARTYRHLDSIYRNDG